MKTKMMIIVMLSCCLVFMGATNKRKIALVVTYQNESGFWRAYGPIQHVNVGGYKSEDEPIQHACGKAKDNLVFIIHIDKYNVYALRKRLESYDNDAREFLAKNGIQFDSNDLIDRIENEIGANEINNQSSAQTQNTYSQSSNNSQFQQKAESTLKSKSTDDFWDTPDKTATVVQQKQKEQTQRIQNNNNYQPTQTGEYKKPKDNDNERQRNEQEIAARNEQRKKDEIINNYNKSMATVQKASEELTRNTSNLASNYMSQYDQLEQDRQAEIKQVKQERIERENAERLQQEKDFGENEDLIYSYFERNNCISNAVRYLNMYPRNQTHIETVNNYLKAKYIEEGDYYYKHRQWSEAKIMYEQYWKRFRDGVNYAYAQNRYYKCIKAETHGSPNGDGGFTGFMVGIGLFTVLMLVLL